MPPETFDDARAGNAVTAVGAAAGAEPTMLLPAGLKLRLPVTA